MKNKIKKINSKNSFITKEKTGYEKTHPVFSFKSYISNDLFTKEMDYTNHSLYNFFNHISVLSQLTWYDIKTRKQYHFHDIENKKNINKMLKIDSDIVLTQFKIIGEQESRIIGYFDNNIFYIVAYDYNHKIYPK
ncbi:hypothetical protein [Treponema sp.]|uniref:hypothetical protein n=1 Tax=Treponema sp. TaxID=166 RepID=UPI003EFED716